MKHGSDHHFKSHLFLLSFLVYKQKLFLANRNGTYCYLRASERREIPLIHLHFTDHMNVK